MKKEKKVGADKNKKKREKVDKTKCKKCEVMLVDGNTYGQPAYYCRKCWCDYMKDYRRAKEAYVYRVTCPDGKFYIGHSINKKKFRIGAHFIPGSTSTTLAVHVNQHGYTEEDVEVDVLFSGSDAYIKSAEQTIIKWEKLNKNPLLLNKR